MKSSAVELKPEPRVVRAGKLHEYRGMSEPYWAKLRHLGGGPPFFKIGTHQNAPVMYALADVDAWLAQHKRNCQLPG